MLSGADLWLIVVTTFACSAAVTAIGAGGLWLNRRGSISSQFVIVIGAAIGSIAVSTLAVVIEMYFTEHDLAVLACVVSVAAALNIAVAWLLTRRTVRRAVGRLLESTAQVGDGNVVAPQPYDWKEFEAISTELALASGRLADSRREIERLDAARKQFFAWISHDLRTPLAGIRAMAEALDEGLAEDPAAYLRQIRARIDAVTGMVDDLFRLSTLQSGTVTLQRETVELLDLVSDAVSDVAPVARTRGIEIHQRGVQGHLVWADPRELTRAIGNLLANAVRHAPDATDILVTAHVRQDAHVVLSVLDHGAGVSSEDLGRIFDVGWRADDARGDGHAGLGLAIVHGIAEAHGGGVQAAHTDTGFRVDLILPGTSGQ